MAMRKEEEKLVLSFKRLVHILTTGRNASFEYGGANLFRSEVHILEMIGKRKGITASEIAGLMGVTKGAVSQVIAKLSEKGLIERTPRSDNAKVQDIHMTQKGIAAMADHDKHEEKLVRSVMAELKNCGTEEIERFIGIVDAVADFSRH
jgi:DNA-binding MarR family transcriptional regulator